MHNLKVENDVLFGALQRPVSLGYSHVESSEKLFKEVREEPEFVGVFAGKKKTNHVVGRQKMTANHKKQTSQVNNFSAFLRMGRGKSLG